MSIIVPSNHTRIGTWVNSKISGRNPPVSCTIPLIVMQEYHTNAEDTESLGYKSVCYITSTIGWVSMKGIYSIDVDVILENCPITIVIHIQRKIESPKVFTEETFVISTALVPININTTKYLLRAPLL